IRWASSCTRCSPARYPSRHPIPSPSRSSTSRKSGVPSPNATRTCPSRSAGSFTGSWPRTRSIQLFPRAQIALTRSLDVFLQNWRKLPAEVEECSPPLSPVPGKLSMPWMEMQTGKDVAVLKIQGRDLPTVRLGDSDRVQIGDNVHVAGYPGVVMEHPYLSPQTVLEASFTRGQVSALRLAVQDSNALPVGAAMTWGNSGGPIFSDAGEVVGMSTFISIAQHTGAAQAIAGFNFAVPTSVVREFLRSAG